MVLVFWSLHDVDVSYCSVLGLRLFILYTTLLDSVKASITSILRTPNYSSLSVLTVSLAIIPPHTITSLLFSNRFVSRKLGKQVQYKVLSVTYMHSIMCRPPRFVNYLLALFLQGKRWMLQPHYLVQNRAIYGVRLLLLWKQSTGGWFQLTNPLQCYSCVLSSFRRSLMVSCYYFCTIDSPLGSTEIMYSLS